MNCIVITPIDKVIGFENKLKDIFNNVYLEPNISKEELTIFLKKYYVDVIFCNPNKQGFVIDESILKDSNREFLKLTVKYIITASTGTNHIDINYCDKNNINVISITKNYNLLNTITSTAELTFFLMGLLIRNIPKSITLVKNYQWNYDPFVGRQLNQMSIGILGYGRLGKMMTNYCEAFGMNINVYDPYEKIPKFWRVDNLDDLFEKSDIITLHVHLTSETRYMIDKNILNKFYGKYLINTSRGDIVNEFDIVQAIKNGNLKGYATDVISHELRNVMDSLIIHAMNMGYNVIVTPHLGGSTIDGMNIAYNGVINEFKKVLTN